MAARKQPSTLKVQTGPLSGLTVESAGIRDGDCVLVHNNAPMQQEFIWAAYEHDGHNLSYCEDRTIEVYREHKNKCGRALVCYGHVNGMRVVKGVHK